MAKKKASRKRKKKKSLIALLFDGIYTLLSSVYSVLDKILITPIAKLLLLMLKPFRGMSKPFDRIFNNRLMLITLSLLLAIILFFFVDNKTQLIMNNSADIIYNKKVKAEYNEEAYVVEGLPNTVDITLMGRQSGVKLAKQYPSEDVIVDLRGLKPGTHKVKLKYKSRVNSVDYKLDPSSATVRIYEKMSESKKIGKEILYENKLDSRYSISNITFSRDEVYVKGAQYKLNKIANVKALLDVRNITNPSIGTTTLKELPLVAYDENGSKVNVEMVPKTIDATLEITSPSKEVPLKVIPEGNVQFGKAVDEVKLSISKVTVYGSDSALSKISYIPVNVNVDGLSKKTEQTVNLSPPSGVKELSAKSVVAEITLGDVKEKTIKNVNIATKSLEKGLTAQASSRKDSYADIIVKGTAANLKDISAENISCYVDLQGLKAGTHNVKVNVTGDNLKLSYTPKTSMVTIVIK